MFQRPDDVARCVLALDAQDQVRLRDCVLASDAPGSPKHAQVLVTESTKKSPTTQAVRVLRDAGVDYTEHLFDHKRYPGAEMAAEALGVDPHQTAKTIVFTTDEGEGAVVVMHGDVEVSAKKLARLLDVKTVDPATQRAARRLTGYQFGGTSPLGMRSDPPVFVHESLAGMDRIYVNGGSRGFLVGIDPHALIELCAARVEDVAAD